LKDQKKNRKAEQNDCNLLQRRAKILLFQTPDPHWLAYKGIYGNGFSPDPDIHAIRQSTNLYAYVMNNPINKVDPDGEQAYRVYWFHTYTYTYNGRIEQRVHVSALGHTLLTNLENILQFQLRYIRSTNPSERASLHRQANAARDNIRNTSLSTTIFGNPQPPFLAAVGRVIRGGNTPDETRRAIHLTADHFRSSYMGLVENGVRFMNDAGEVIELTKIYLATYMASGMFNPAQCQPANTSNKGNAYTPPAGGGGISTTIRVNGKTITFGHGARHLQGTNLSVNQVNQAIANEVSRIHPGTGRFHKGQITINGTRFEYTSFGVSDGVINIGTYYLKP
jgi:hypothetical protein